MKTVKNFCIEESPLPNLKSIGYTTRTIEKRNFIWNDQNPSAKDLRFPSFAGN
jgi:hypothetical protein